MEKSIDFMKRTLDLAMKGRGRTSPNPMVGAIVVQNGRIISEGYHRKAGGVHAEVEALRKARSGAQRATLYVNLEPCSYRGRTPPCVDMIITSGIREVHLSHIDPNPRVNGNGIKKLKSHGIAVFIGECEQQARKLNEVFIKYISSKSPFVIAKFAMTLDGKIASRTGDSRWISGGKARYFVHILRDWIDAVIIGVGTVIADNPRLTTRLNKKEVKQPLRIIVDSTGKTPLLAEVISGKLPGKTIIATTEKISTDKLQAFEAKGVEIAVLPSSKGRVDLVKLMAFLGEREISSVLVEGGGELLSSFFSLQLVDKLHAFVAPKIIGGKSAPTPVGGEGIKQMNKAIQLTKITVKKIGTDVLITGYPET